jgi:hypothetical protein
MLLDIGPLLGRDKSIFSSRYMGENKIMKLGILEIAAIFMIHLARACYDDENTVISNKCNEARICSREKLVHKWIVKLYKETSISVVN